MKKEGKSSISIIKIICVSLILIILSGAGVIAMTTKLNTVTITLSNGYEMTVLTNKTKVSEILKENNIVVKTNEKVTPSLDEEIDTNNTIKICDKSIQEIQVAKISENGVETTLEDILSNYSPIVEKIVVEEVAIPYETITKDVTNEEEHIKNKVITKGEEGIKLVTFKIKYKNNEEISRTILSEVIVKEPVDKVVQVQKDVTSRATTTRTTKTAIFRVTGYCSCSKCCGKFSSGYTSSGTKATAGRTVATSSQYNFGTKLLINGTVYTVEDRGGSITGNKIDIYFDTHDEAIAWGVKYLPVEVIE